MMFSDELPNQSKERPFYFIAAGVVMVHLLLLSFFYFGQTRASPRFQQKSPARLLVHTVALSPPQQNTPKLVAASSKPAAVPQSIPKVESKPQEVPKPKPQVATPPIPKKVESPAKVPPPKPAAKKQEVPQKKTPVPAKEKTAAKQVAPPQEKEAQQRKKDEEKKKAEEKIEQARQQALVSQAQERIAKIAQSRDKINPTKSEKSPLIAVAPITNLQVDELPGAAPSSLNDEEALYRHELAGRLKLFLRLPEYGMVKIKLTVDSKGKVVKVVVVSAESTLNKQYVEKTVPTMTFPSFGNRFGGADQHTFAVTLTNE